MPEPGSARRRTAAVPRARAGGGVLRVPPPHRGHPRSVYLRLPRLRCGCPARGCRGAPAGVRGRVLSSCRCPVCSPVKVNPRPNPSCLSKQRGRARPRLNIHDGEPGAEPQRQPGPTSRGSGCWHPPRHRAGLAAPPASRDGARRVPRRHMARVSGSQELRAAGGNLAFGGD